MRLKTPEGLTRSVCIVLGIWIVNAALISYFLGQIDTLINVELYSFGLQFNEEWAVPYWTSLRLMYAFAALQIGLIAVFVAWVLIRMRRPVLEVSMKRKKEPQMEVLTEVPTTEVEVETPEAPVALEQKTPETGVAVSIEESLEAPPAKTTEEEQKVTLPSSIIISCPTCGKTFSRPLVMLDFGGGKTRLVDVCPYCKHILEQHSNDQ
jgi:uncharacterized Zn-finger protein